MGLAEIFKLFLLPAVVIAHTGVWGEVGGILQNFNPRFFHPFAFSAGGISGQVYG